MTSSQELLPQALRIFRLRHRLTQEELAHALGVDRNTVSRWELGQSLPESPKLLELALEGLQLRYALTLTETRSLMTEVGERIQKGVSVMEQLCNALEAKTSTNRRVKHSMLKK